MDVWRKASVFCAAVFCSGATCTTGVSLAQFEAVSASNAALRASMRMQIAAVEQLDQCGSFVVPVGPSCPSVAEFGRLLAGELNEPGTGSDNADEWELHRGRTSRDLTVSARQHLRLGTLRATHYLSLVSFSTNARTSSIGLGLDDDKVEGGIFLPDFWKRTDPEFWAFMDETKSACTHVPWLCGDIFQRACKAMSWPRHFDISPRSLCFVQITQVAIVSWVSSPDDATAINVCETPSYESTLATLRDHLRTAILRAAMRRK